MSSDWLRLPVHRWITDNDFIVARQFVKGLSVVNEAAERCITDYAEATRDSVYREDIILIGNSHREIFQDLRKAALARINPYMVMLPVTDQLLTHCTFT